MSPIPFADNFLAGSLLSLLLPTGLLIAIAIWYVRAVRHVPEDTPESSPALPTAEVVAAAPPAETGITPAGPPPGEIV
jgi:hypothetical protein